MTPFSARCRWLAAALILGAAFAKAAAPPASNLLARGQLVDSLGLIEPRALALWRDGFGRPQALYVDVTRLRLGQASPAALILSEYTGYSWTRRELASLLITAAPAGSTTRDIELVAQRRSVDASVHVLLTERRATGHVLRYLRFGGAGTPLDETVATGDIGSPRLTVDPAGAVYAAWIPTGSSPGGARVARRQTDGSWPQLTPTTESVSSLVLVSHPDATGALLGWLETTSTSTRARNIEIPSGGPPGLVETLLVGEAGDEVLELALSAGPQQQREAILVRRFGGNGYVIEHRARREGKWVCFHPQQVGCRITASTVRPELPAQGFQQANERRALAIGGADPHLLRSNVGTSVWTRISIGSNQPAAVALADANGSPMALSAGASDDTHRDLQLLTAGPQWSARRVPNDSNTRVHGALALASDAIGNPLLLARFNAAGNDVRLLRWDAAGNDFAQQPLPAVGILLGASLAHAGDDGVVHAALVTDQGLLHMAHLDGLFTLTPVVAGAGSASEPTLLRTPDGRPAIVFLDAQRRPRIAVRAAAGGWQIAGMGESSVPANGGLRAVIATEGFLVHATFHDGQRLRHARRQGDFTSEPSSLTLGTLPPLFSFNTVVGEAHATALLADGGLAVAFSGRDPLSQNTRLGYLALTHDGMGTGGDVGDSTPSGAITAIALTVGQGSPLDPRVLWAQHDAPGATSPPRLLFAQGRLIPHEDFGLLDLGAGVRPQIGLFGEGRVTVGWVDGQDLQLARRQPAVPQDDAPLPAEYTGRSTGLNGYNFLSYCFCIGIFGPEACRGITGRGLPATVSVTSSDPLIARLRQHFAGTEAGRYYLALWTRHGEEITQLTLSQPDLLSQRWRTWADFRPGLEALVDGRGHEVPFSEDLVRSARAVWLGWTGPQASEELRATVTAELARLDQFEGFVGLGFDQWFAQLTPGAPQDRLLSDGFESADPQTGR